MLRTIAMLVSFTLAFAIVVRPEARGDIDVKAAKVIMLEGIAAKFESELKQLDAQIEAEPRPDVQLQLVRARKELQLLKKRIVDDVGTIDALWDAITTAHQSLVELDTGVDRAWVGPLHTHLLAAKKVSDIVKVSQVVGTGVDYAFKFKKMGEDIGAIDSALLSPGTKRMAQSLTALSHILSIFGDKVPMFGSVLKAYGDLAVELTKVTLALDGKIEAREQGQLLPGVHGERSTMFDQLARLGMSDAQRVDGTRDVFRGSDGRLMIWDRAIRGWVIASDIENGISEEEIIKRYLFFMSHGTSEPTPEQIIRGYHRAIVLELKPSTTHVAPGGTVELHVVGRTAHDDKPIEKRELYAQITMTHTGIGEGDMPGSERIKIGEKITWTAPSNVNETYTFTADLAPETVKSAISGGPAVASVRTGYETRLELTAASAVAAGTPLELTAKLFSLDGKPMPAAVAGSIELTAEPGLGYFTDFVALTDQKGTTFTWMAPDVPGKVVFTARYAGATGYGMFGDHTAGADAKITVTVGAPQIDAGVGDGGVVDTTDPADADETAVDAAEPMALDAGTLDWPGTWKGKMKTTVMLDGNRSVGDQVIELVVKRLPDGKISIGKPGSPDLVLTPTPSNPRAATATLSVPPPANMGLVKLLSYKGEVKWTAFLADSKLNLALHLTVDSTVEPSPGFAPQSSSYVSDSIGQLEKIQ